MGPGGLPDLGAGPQLSPEEEAEAREQLRQIREQLAGTPVADIVANHVIGLWELAILHLTGVDETAGPNLREASVAIDAVAALVEGLGDRLGQNAEPLREALAQLRLAYVEASRGAPGEEA
jgi:hypothetical protein